jgi:hypothetical protein
VDISHEIEKFENTSDHDPIYLDLDILHFSLSTWQLTSKAAWYRAKTEELASYSDSLHLRLADSDILVDSILCCDVFCCDNNYTVASKYI